ncbi:VOC family protein [Streptomyces thermoalcalitolerans]|uniref:VOC family protein n=1 Tax=Streptomyces thermoalcalitolerans TaxID=65605 RepID=A0ABN1PFD1_9ACTN
MVSMVQNVAIDCANPYELAQFWSKVTGCPVDPDSKPGDPEAQVMLPTGPLLHFNEVPEPKTGKNRVHLCLRPETSREEEVERLLGLGATLVADRREPDGSGWAVLADPEGNEFCVLRSESDRAAMASRSSGEDGCHDGPGDAAVQSDK